LEGIEWVTNYYFNQCISRDWYYRYNYSVTILDVYNFMLMNMGNLCELLNNSIHTNYPQIQYDTDLQLLMCLPPCSKSLLKPEFRAILSDVSLGCVHLYPEKFKMTSYLKNFLWEASPLLPLVDVEKLQQVKMRLMISK
jgi:5'-3' exonuclease